ncbi:MAG: Mur ligase family protein [Candidatus Gottesmanbacteria bacterium]|nr:Mur ligase family protein [Candidatus Gottesmanbacteria bacterium]
MKRIKAFLVPFVLRYLRTIGRLALSRSRATVIGIAGSVGKTSTREALFAILKDVGPTHMVSGNSETGVPLGLVGLFPHDYSPADWARMMVTAPLRVGFLKHIRYIIVEMGIDDPYPPKNMEYLLTIVKPDIGIITEESAAHTMQFEKILDSKIILTDSERLKFLVEAITREDAKMIKQDKCALGIVNGDNKFLTPLSGSKVLTFGRSNDAAIRITDYSVDIHKTTFSYVLGDTPITFQFKGFAFPKDLVYVFAPAILAAYKLNIPLDVIKKNLEKNFTPPRGRESLLAGINNSIIIDSSYNASKPSVLSFLEMTATLKRQSRRHTIVVLADMLELGNESQIEHEAVARAIGTIPDTLYLVGPLTKRFILPIVEKKLKHVEWFPSVIELNQALSNIPIRSLILFKGSQGNLWLEESIKLLLKNKEDVSRLCRQNAFWQRVKKAAGRWVEV